jgi:hypothetical protein
MSAIDDLLPRPRTCCSDLDLDRLALGELSAERAAEVNKHLAESPSCAARSAEFMGVHLLERPLPPPRAATNVPARLRHITQGVLFAAALAAAMLFVVRPSDDVVTMKGDGDAFEVFVSRPSGDGVLGEGARVAPGDRLRFVVHTTAPQTVAVLSIDGAGTVSVYSPPRPLAPGRAELPGAIELDNVRGREVLMAFTCDHAVDAGSLVAAVKAGTTPAGCDVMRHTLEKP